MGVLGSIKKTAKKVAETVETVVNSVEEVVSDVVDTVGNDADDTAEAASNFLEDHVPSGKYIGDFLEWVGRVVSGALDVVSAVIKGVLGIISGVLGGAIRIIGGILSMDSSLIIEGFLDILSGVVGTVVLIVGKAIAFVQAVLLIQAFERKLTRAEVKLLKRVFWDSIALYNVRIIEGRAGIYGINDRSFTLGNTIYMKSHDPFEEPELLVHECTHVWQFQNKGVLYAGDAIGAQWFIKDAYDWECEIDRGNADWGDFNKEAQAEFLGDIYLEGELIVGGVSTKGDGVFYDADSKERVGRFEFNRTDHTARANDAVAEVRGAKCMRLSARWS